MADPYWRYGVDRATLTGGGSIPSFPGYLPPEPSTLTSHHLWSSSSSDFLHKDILASRSGAYGADDILSVGVRPEPVIGGFSAGATIRGYLSPLDDPSLLGRRDTALGIGPGIPDIISEGPGSLRKADSLPAASRESNVLFVDGLPNDCSRRETGDKAMVLCFVEFSDSKCALTALEALQGYKFDNKKPDSAALRIHFAHFPFRLPSDREEPRFAVPK